MLASRFRVACKRHGLADRSYQKSLDISQFQRPGQQQLGLNL
jgi:hypothetical protein